MASSCRLHASLVRQGPAVAHSGRGEREMSAVKLLVVGADGQLGSDVVRLLSPTVDVTARVMDELDVTDRAALREVIEASHPEVVVNCAAYTAVDRAETEQDAAYRVNVLGAR
ncbi:NAD-dependent epimerase/dehydratase family protein, partial [Candidatus Cryosericum odellii]